MKGFWLLAGAVALMLGGCVSNLEGVVDTIPT